MNHLPADFFQQADAWKDAQNQEEKKLVEELTGDIEREKAKILGEFSRRAYALEGQATHVDVLLQILGDVVAEYMAGNTLYRVDGIDVYLQGDMIRTLVNLVRRMAA